MSNNETPEQRAVKGNRRKPKPHFKSTKLEAQSEEYYVTRQHEEENLDYMRPSTSRCTTAAPKQTDNTGEQVYDEEQNEYCRSDAATGSTMKDADLFLMARAGARPCRTKAPPDEDVVSPDLSKGRPSLPDCSSVSFAEYPAAIVGGSKLSASHATPFCCDFDKNITITPPAEKAVQSGDEARLRINELKKTYFNNYEATKRLPIYEQRQQIIDSINSYNVVIIEGDTGCGKTTQVPVFILEDAILNRSSDTLDVPMIYVTQPRRIAAKSIAERVNLEHGWTMPSVAGYQISLDKVAGPDTVLLFCTPGVLLNKIVQERSLKNYTHIIIDEAHERDADTDLLLMMIRKLMWTEITRCRLIIMSAATDFNKLKKYFTLSIKGTCVTAPCHIKFGSNNRSASMIQTKYLDSPSSDLEVPIQMPMFDISTPVLHEECLSAAVQIIVEMVPKLDNYANESNSTLVFLPGLAEILRLDAMIKRHNCTKDNIDIITLHSCLNIADQFRVFKKSHPGCRKVILATNIAESSITIPDVGLVIDFCLAKTLIKDKNTRFPTLTLNWESQDKCAQRAGRTGRCCPGKVIRMVPEKFFIKFREFAEPELLTAPLELSVLRIKKFQLGEIKALFAFVIDPPPINEIQTAVLELKQIGALAATYKGSLSNIDGDLTDLGHVITALPIDVNLSKLIMVASVFDVLEDAIIVAASLSTNRSVVRFSHERSLEGYELKLNWSYGSHSDLFVSLNCYKEYKRIEFESDRRCFSWCRGNNLDQRKLIEVDALVSEIKKRLETLNIFGNTMHQSKERDPNIDHLMLKLSFCAAFYPRYFITEPIDGIRVTKELCGMDPLRTVVLSGFPPNQVQLYKGQATKQLRQKVCRHLDFIADVSRAYLVLKDVEEIDHEGDQLVASALKADEVLRCSVEVPKVVYRALKFGECYNIQVLRYNDIAAMSRFNIYNQQKQNLAQKLDGKLLPPCMKVLDGGEVPDNSRLVCANEFDYWKITGQAPYYEVASDSKQDAEDIHALSETEKHDARNRREHKKNSAQTSCDIYGSEYRKIRGPHSPICMSFRSIQVKSRGYVVKIDSQSVNSILLDSQYKRAKRQMLVAAIVTQSKDHRVLVRDTTLMPNIRGLPTIMALLFAQHYRLIYNNELKCIAGGVFGIGWTKEDDTSLDRQYEVDLSFDVHITNCDIHLINLARSKMSHLLKFTENYNSAAPQAKLQVELREIILKLIRTKRYPLAELDMSMVDYPGTRENIFTKDTHNLPDDVLQEGYIRPFLPLMKYTCDCDEWQLYESIRNNLTYLTNIEQNIEPMPMGGVKCLVCGNGQKFCFIMALKVEDHLRTEGHKEKVAEFEIFEKNVSKKLSVRNAKFKYAI